MDMPNLSPGFSSRFANIEIGHQRNLPAKSPRKQYPPDLYPQNYGNTIPSRAPKLSTAVRAESRTLATPKQQNAVPPAPKRNLRSIAPDAVKDNQYSPSQGREGKQSRYQDFPFSFMRETSSSRKKQSSMAAYDRTFPQTRSSSHPEVLNRRAHYLSLASKKRQLSKTTTPADITNKFVDQPACAPFADKPTMFSTNSPSRRLASGNYGGLKPKEDVYTRLYNSAVKLRQKLDDSRSPLGSRSNTPTSVRLHLSTVKPSTLDEMYQVIYKAEPALFEDSNSLNMALVPNKPYIAQELVAGLDGNHLSMYERGEIMRSNNLYYVPRFWLSSESGINISSFKNNYGFDDQNGNYVIRLKDHIEYRYEILRVLGTGSFGNVVLCVDHKYTTDTKTRKVAIKIIKNELDWSLQAVSEIKMLKHLTQAQESDGFNNYIMNYCDHFHFRGHMCIVTEVLSINLYTFLELGSFRGVSLGLLRSFIYKILKGIEFVHHKRVIHCDIKPENIMIQLPLTYTPGLPELYDFGVKIIDFGSSCFEKETSFSYIQSRFYRAPEVILGAKYSYEIDMWSFGCVVAELFSGTPLLPGKTELEQVGLILEMFGAPSSSYILSERRKLLRSFKNFGATSLNDPLVSDHSPYLPKSRLPIDERKLKKTLLYSLFNHEGKVNLQFLNQQLQALESSTAPLQTVSPFRRNIKVGSRSLDVALRLLSSGEEKQDIASFSKFMGSIFQWNPKDRATATQLLQSPFMK